MQRPETHWSEVEQGRPSVMSGVGALVGAIVGTVVGTSVGSAVGTSVGAKFEMRDGVPTIVKLAEDLFVDDKEGKPVGIYQHIGRRPIFAAGNSDGDLQMLQYTTIQRDRADSGGSQPCPAAVVAVGLRTFL